ncbi:BglG family transcription antiterminator [Lacticaseibacillus daqingensis]|uniref:BglG family transcription antiterminator n=1 Tax=Lacticaseibacillus daqingensis TaxID=2486014 RepID=UPI000F7A9F94|nr:HTH domain-containing protein [Lacticaseibacillus daqingensis]
MNTEFTNRELLIIGYLKKSSEYVTSASLASYFGVSSRTIKKDLERISEIVNQDGEYLISLRGKGYLLQSNYPYVIGDTGLVKFKDLILNNYDRVAYLTQKILLAKEFLRYEDLADEIFVSYSTLSRYMQRVQELFVRYDLEIIRKPNRGIYVTGDEVKLRLAISDCFYHNFISRLSAYNQGTYDKDATKLALIRGVVKSVTSNHHIDLNDSMVNDIAIHTIIAVSRIEAESRLHYAQTFNTHYSDSIERRVATELLNLLSGAHTKVSFTDNTIKYIAYQLSLKKMIRTVEGETDANEAGLCLKHVVAEIADNFGIDLSGQTALLHALLLHIIQLKKRVDYQVPIQGHEIFDNFRNYLFAAKMTISAAKIISRELLSAELPIGEYGYLILYFQSAIEVIGYAPKVIGLYTAHNRAEQLLYSARINRIKSPRLTVRTIENPESPQADVDILISSRDIKNSYAAKTLVIKDANRLTSKQLEGNSLNYELSQQIIGKYVNEYSFLRIKARSKADVDEQIRQYFVKIDNLKAEALWQLDYKEVGNGLVHIHDIKRILRRNLCLVVALDTPILWDNTVVKVLIMIKTKRDGDKDLNFLCTLFSALMNDPESIEAVYSATDAKQLFNVISALNKRLK